MGEKVENFGLEGFARYDDREFADGQFRNGTEKMYLFLAVPALLLFWFLVVSFPSMIRQIAPVFFTLDIAGTLAYYTGKLGFRCLGTWQDPPVYAIVGRDQHAIHFRCAEPPGANPNKYLDELLDAYLLVEDADALYAEYAARGVEFTRELGNTPWNCREFVVKDCDGRLLAFGANL